MYKKLFKVILFLLVVTGIGVAVVFRDYLAISEMEVWIRSAGIAGPVVFVLIYALAAVLFLPGSVLTLAGGALFGPVWGTVFNLAGATIGATISFLIARYLASNWVENKTGGRLKQIKNGVEGEGWRFVAFVRLVPLFPFNVLNYALGLTHIKLSHYIIASLVCMAPGGIAYTYLGYAGREAVAGGEGLVQKIMLALALLAVVVFLPRFVGKIRQKPMLDVGELKTRLDQNEDLLLLDVRDDKEFIGVQGHIPGATNIPLNKLKQRLTDIIDFEEEPVAIICRTDKRSAKAAQLLSQQGFADIHVVRGGMTAWNKSNNLFYSRGNRNEYNNHIK